MRLPLQMQFAVELDAGAHDSVPTPRGLLPGDWTLGPVLSNGSCESDDRQECYRDVRV